MRKELDYRELLVKFLAGEISDNEADVLKEWLKKDPDNRQFFDIEMNCGRKQGKDYS